MSSKRNSSKAQVNWQFESSDTNTRAKKRRNKKISKTLWLKGFMLALVCLLIFGAIGAGSIYFVCRDDCFEIVGSDIELAQDCPYFDEGAKVIEFGKDISNKVQIETNMLINADGSFSPQLDNDNNPILDTYYIIYKVDSFKYGKFATVEKVRLVKFVEISESQKGDI